MCGNLRDHAAYMDLWYGTVFVDFKDSAVGFTGTAVIIGVSGTILSVGISPFWSLVWHYPFGFQIALSIEISDIALPIRI